MPFHFQIDFQPTGKGRKIKGVISTPREDREREIIHPKALREALTNFMKHPILHVNHTERSVGYATSAIVKASGETEVEAEIYDTSDTDDVWNEIQKGSLCKWSIYGRRKLSEGPCHVQPHQRMTPCITKSLDLWSVSLVGNNAINSETYVEIAKAHLPEDEITPFVENLALIYKSEPCNDTLKGDIMVPDPEDKKQEDTVQDNELVKSDPISEERLVAMETSLAGITTAIGDLANIVKSTIPAPADDTQPPVDDIMTKAKIELEPIIKAKVEEALGEIKKSFDAIALDVETLKKSVDSMKEQVIRKSGPVVMVGLLDDKTEEYNPQKANAAMIGA